MSSTGLARSFLCVALLLAVVSFVARGERRRAPALAAAVGVAVLLFLALTRRAWEHSVRHPVWVLDTTRGVWLERGVDWLLSAALFALAAASTESHASRADARFAWSVSAALAAGAGAALAWGSRAFL